MKNIYLAIFQLRQWTLAGVMVLALPVVMTLNANAYEPKDCGQPNPDNATVQYCESINIPAMCFQQNLPEEEQRSCDQQRFQGEPHYNVVRLSPEGAVRSVRLLRTDTGRVVFNGYPHGIAFAAPGNGDKEVRMHTEFLTQFLNARPTPGSLTATSDNYATGLPIGWSNSVGVAPGQCLNYTIVSADNGDEQVSFLSQNAASSTSEQIKVSATVQGSYDAFKASDTFSYSDNYKSSTNSSNQYFNLFSLWSLNTTVDSSNPLTAQGQNAGTSFDTLCGTQYMEAAPVGMVATLSISYGSSSQTTQTAVSNKFKASFGLDSVSTAVSTASSDTSSSSYFSFVMNHYGGGVKVSNDLNDAMSKTDPTSNEAYYALCASGDSTACDTFTSNLGVGGTNALNDFDGLVDDLKNQTNPDVSFFQAFPNGVANATSLPALVTFQIPHTTNDVLAPYKTQLEQYTSLLNQIATLNNRTVALNNALQTGNHNPAQVLDLAGYLDTLENVYKSDQNTLLTNMQTCLAATRSNVTTACDAIINNTALNAFEYYAVGQHPNFFAQQNTLALQYVANVYTIYPADVMYIDTLPNSNAFTQYGIGGAAAFAAFADQADSDSPSVPMLALTSGKPISTNNVADNTWINSSDFYFFTATGGTADNALGVDIGSFSTTTCTPTFDNPCTIDYNDVSPSPDLFTNRQIEGLFGDSPSVAALEGTANGVGSGRSNAELHLKGTVEGVGDLDLSAAKLELTRLLHETNGSGELLGNGAGDVTPLILTAVKGSTPTNAIFKTPRWVRPEVQARVKLTDPEKGELKFNIEVNRATIDSPQLCDQAPEGYTKLQAHFVLADGVNKSTMITTEQDWRCRRNRLITGLDRQWEKDHFFDRQWEEDHSFDRRWEEDHSKDLKRERSR